MSERTIVARETEAPPRSLFGWKTAFFLGLATFVLGWILTFRPVNTLIAIAVLIGVTIIVAGVYQIVRALDGREHERVWRGIAGVVAILAGLVLLRHLHLTVALIGLFVGIAWIVQGVAAIMESASGGSALVSRGWSLFFGIISLVAGIILISAPINSLRVLTIFIGIWFIVMGFFQMIGALVSRIGRRKREREWEQEQERERAREREAAEMSVPQQRGDVASSQDQPSEVTPGQKVPAESRRGWHLRR